jgi:hypothetical protein
MNASRSLESVVYLVLMGGLELSCEQLPVEFTAEGVEGVAEINREIGEMG